MVSAEKVKHLHLRPCVVILVLDATKHLHFLSDKILRRCYRTRLSVSRKIVQHDVLRTIRRRTVLRLYGIKVDMPVSCLVAYYRNAAFLSVGGASAAVGYGNVHGVFHGETLTVKDMLKGEIRLEIMVSAYGILLPLSQPQFFE